MDSMQYIHPNTPVIMAVLSIVLLLVAIYYAKPWLIGLIGSNRIQKELSALQKKGAIVMNHIQLTTKQGELIHIDHLIITNSQMIAVSILGYSGEIMGSIRASSWTQETANGSHRFANPLKNHEAITATIQGALGDRMQVKAITAFTAGNLHTESEEVLSASSCAGVLHAAIEENTAGAKQQWAQNILRNIALAGADSKIEKERAFLVRQGSEQQLQLARVSMSISSLLMLLAIILAGIRAAAQHGFF